MLRSPNAANDVNIVEDTPDSKHRMAKVLQTVIIIGQITLVSVALLFFIGGALMAFSTGFQEQFFAATGIEDKPNIMMLPFLCVSGGIIALAWFSVLFILRRIVGSLIEGDPFIPANISRLRLMWVVIALTEVFRMIVNSIGGTFSDGSGTFQIRIGVWFLVFVIATLSEAFRYGAAMRQEQELTI